MDAERPAPAQLAKGALRRLALSKREPTPANFARAYAEEAGDTVPAEGLLPPRARVMVDRLVARASDDAALRTELAGALMEARYDDLQRALGGAGLVQQLTCRTHRTRAGRALQPQQQPLGLAFHPAAVFGQIGQAVGQ